MKILPAGAIAQENPLHTLLEGKYMEGELWGVWGGGLSFLVACVAFQFHNSNDLVIVEEKQILGDLEGNGSWPPP